MGLNNGKKLHSIPSSISISALKSIVRNYCHVYEGIDVDGARDTDWGYHQRSTVYRVMPVRC